MAGLKMQLSQHVFSAQCSITSEGRDGGSCLARLDTDGVYKHLASLLLSQSKHCVLLVMLNRRTCFGSSTEVEAEGESWEKRDSGLELVMPLPLLLPTCF